jgi:Ala-tRNA(Pro) deacylase
VPCRDRLLDLLLSEGVPYRLDNQRGVPPAERGDADAGSDLSPTAKTVVVFADHWPLILLLANNRYVDISRLLRSLGSHSVRVANRYEIARLFPDCDVDAVPAIGRIFGIPVYMDLDLAQQAEITFMACTRYDVITMPMTAFEQVASPIRTAISLPPRTPDAA